MNLTTQRHLARAFRNRLCHSRIPGGVLEKRRFSDESEKEKDALLRALRSSPTSKTTVTSEKRREKNSFSSGFDQQNVKNLSDDTIERKPIVRPKESLRGRKQRPRRKKTTLDDFFAEMGSSGSSGSNKQSQRKRERSLRAAIQTETKNSASVDKKVDIISFFDEVNTMVEKKKKSQPEENTDEQKRRNNFSENLPESSILDLMPPPKSRSPNAYDEELFHQYSDMLKEITSSRIFFFKRGCTIPRVSDTEAKLVIEWLESDEPVVECNLPLLGRAMSEVISEEDGVSEGLRSELRGQKKIFMEHLGWNHKQYSMAMGGLLNMGALCVKRATSPPLEIAWQKLKEAGYPMDKKSLHNFLYVSSTFSTRPMETLFRKGGSVLDLLDGIDGKSEEIKDSAEETIPDENEKKIDLASEIAMCHDLLFEPSEQSTSIHVRTLVSQGKAKEAENVLNKNANSNDLRLRTYSPVFNCYLDQGDVAAAFKLLSKMKEGEFVKLQPENYVQLMACIAENGFFAAGAKSIDGVQEMGYSAGSGPMLFDALASELAEITVEITSASAKRLYNAFQAGFQGNAISDNLKPLHLLESLKICNDPASLDELVVNRIALDEKSGRCPRTGVQLRLINLDAEQKKKLQTGLSYLSATTYEERHRKKNSIAEDSLKSFGKWLEERPGDPFTAIIDGPNVAYYMQNFQQGTFNFNQIKFVVDALEKMGENVLVIIPKKYTYDNFLITKSNGSVKQSLSEKEKSIRDELVSSGKVYIVPVGCLDDYYWMYASVSSQNSSMDQKVMYIPPGNAEGRWPGIRPMLLSNDKMRDHKLSLLEPRLFRRWYSNFIVNFTFSAFIRDECTDKEIGFSTADFYSREIQGNDVIDENGIKRGKAWHFPISDWDENESFCIRIPE